MKPKLILCCALFCTVGSVRAIAPESNLNQIKTEVSPQLDAMMRYDNTNVSLCAGRINQTVPLIQFNDPDFDFPIAVSYSSSGFRPTQADNITGIHWMLDAGGVIYRDIKGVPDDSYSFYCEKRGSGHERINGFTWVGSLGYDKELKKNELMTMTDPQNKLFVGDYNSVSTEQYATFAGTNIEASSDIYNFNFCGHSGRFMLNFDGSVSVMSNNGRKYKVDLSYYRYSDTNSKYKSELRIITDDGYIYCFGGDLSAMEYTALSWVGYEPLSNVERRNQIVAYYLTRIIAPNGRELLIRYENKVPNEYHDRPFDLKNKGSQSHYDEAPGYKLLYRYSHFTPNSYIINYTLQKVAIISSIETDLVKVDFSYSDVEGPTVSTSFFFAEACHGRKLDAVEMRSVRGQLLDKSDLSYEYSNPNYRLFLKSVANIKSGKYEFKYHTNATIPSTLTSNIDYWGFWRGRPENNTLNPEVDYLNITDGQYTLKALDNSREPTLDTYDLTLLSDLIFPTGGWAHFEYEPHIYYSTFGQDYPSYFYIMQTQDTNFTKFAGGARIKRISYYTGYGKRVKEKCYQYTSDKEGNYSTGILMCKPIFALREYNSWTHSSTPISVTYDLNNFKQSPAFSDLVQYELVREYDIVTPGKDLPRDSLYNISISPLSAERQREATVRVGDVPQEYRHGKWSIWGKPYHEGGGTSRLQIYNQDSMLVWEKIFAQPGVEETEEFNPVSKLGRGTYRIVLEADPMARVNFQAFYRFAKDEHFEGSYTETRFTTAETNVDRYASNPFESNPQTRIVIDNSAPEEVNWWANDPLLVERYLADPDDRSHERGKVLSVKYYSAEDALLRSEEYRYKPCASEDVVWVNAPHLVHYKLGLGFYSYVNKQNFNSYLPVEKKTTTFDPTSGQSLQQNETFTYTDDGYLQHYTQGHTDGSATRQSYECVGMASQQNAVYQAMQKRNLEWSPRQITELVSADSVNFQLVKKTEYSYGMCELRDTLSPIPVCTATAESFATSPIENRIEYQAYDRYGNPTQMLVNDTQSTVLIWGYTGKYLVAKIENATYDEVENKLGATYLAEFPENAYPDIGRINALREQLPNAQISTYTYIPGRGMISATSPAGQTTTYVYDNSGRLCQIELTSAGGTPQVLKSYQYHLVNQ